MMELTVLSTQSMLNKARSLEFEPKAGDSMSLVGFLLAMDLLESKIVTIYEWLP